MNTFDTLIAFDDEIALIGCCMQGDAEVISQAFDVLPLVTSEQVVDSVKLIKDLSDDKVEVDFESLGKAWNQRFKDSCPVDLWVKAMDIVPSATHLPIHLAAIKESARRRKAIYAAEALMRTASDKDKSLDAALADLESALTQVNESSVDPDESSEFADSKTVSQIFLNKTQERFNRKGQLSGIPSGFRDLDSLTDGIQLGELFLIAARPSIGKTAMGVSIMANACLISNVPTLFVTAEMSQEAIMRRLVSTAGSIPMKNIKTGMLTDYDMTKMMQTLSKISKAPMYFHSLTGGADIASVTSGIRKMVKRYKVKLVIVDYLQKIQGNKSEKKTYEVGDVSTKLKQVAASLNIAVVALAQINRDGEKDGTNSVPKLSHLAESGQIERDADTVCLLDRNRAESKGKALLIIAKQRDGECGTIELGYEGAFCRFYDLPFDA